MGPFGYKKENIQRSSGSMLQIKYKQIPLNNQTGQNLHDMIERAFWMIQESLALIMSADHPKVKKHAARYFFCNAGTGPTQKDLFAIQAVLHNTLTGISSDMTVKVRPIRSAYGYVKNRPAKQSDLHTVRSSGGSLIVKDGPITVDADLLENPTPADDDLAVITFIHEATHKFANTWDHGDSGYVLNNGTAYTAPGLTHDQALQNADSYAWFVFKLTRKYVARH